ncbi:MAG: SMC-Scp complex subunit ScpB [Aerococcus sp.]|nr:SMC-Scp complex subunit ScpB [Aerococcus sp.]
MNDLGALESLLFVAGEDGLSVEEASALLGVYPDHIRYALERLKLTLEQNPQAGITLRQVHGRFQLATKAAYGEIIKQYAQSPFATRLTQAALETLAIVAYESPVTRMQIDQIRGVQSNSMLKKLMQHGLIEEQGRQDSPGHPILYGVTDYFYQYFGLNSLDDLPDLAVLTPDNETTHRNLYEHMTDQLESPTTESR